MHMSYKLSRNLVFSSLFSAGTTEFFPVASEVAVEIFLQVEMQLRKIIWNVRFALLFVLLINCNIWHHLTRNEVSS
jgi:hypothetical protein